MRVQPGSFSPIGRFLIVTASVVVVLAALKVASSVVTPILLAIVLAIAFTPVVAWFESKHLPTWAAVLLTILLVLSLGFIVTGSLYASLSQLDDKIPVYQRLFAERQRAFTAWLSDMGIRVDKLPSAQILNPQRLLGVLSVVVSALLGALSYVFIVLILLTIMLLESPRFIQRSHASLDGREQTMDRLHRLARSIQDYLRISALNNLFLGVAVTILLLAVGVDFAILWGLLAFALSYIPSVGLILAATPAVLLALLEFGIGRALIVVAGVIVLNFVGDYVLSPRMAAKGLNVSAATMLVSAIIWTYILGPLGAILSPPLTVGVKLLLESTEQTKWLAELLSAEEETNPDNPA